MKITTISVLLSAVLLSSGCCSLSPKQKTELIQENTKALYSNAKANLASGRAIASGSTAPIDAAEQSLSKEIDDSNAKFSAIRQEIEEQKRQLNEFFTAAISSFAELVPGGTLASKAALSIQKKLNTSNETGKTLETANNELKNKIEETTASSKREIERIRNDSNIEIEKLKAQIASSAASTQSQLALIEKTFKSFSSEEKAQLKDEILKAAKENGVSEKDLETLKSKSPEDLIALFGGGGVGLAALLRTLGRSRSQNEIDEHYDKITEIDKKLERKADIAEIDKKLERKVDKPG